MINYSILKYAEIDMAEKQIYTFPDGTTLIYYQQNYNKCTDVNVGFRIPKLDIPYANECIGLYKNVVFYMDAANPAAPIRIPLIKPGIAHLAEHMFFTSLPDMKKEDLLKMLTKTNTEYNASTSQDFVKTEFNCPSKFVNEIFELESRMIFRDCYDADDLKLEKEPVYQELEMILDKDAPNILSFLNNNYETLQSSEILGIDKKIIDSITEKQLIRFCKTYFTRQNMIITCVSDLPFEKIKELCEKNFVEKAPSIIETKIYTPQRVYSFYNDVMYLYPNKKANTVSIYFMLKGTNDIERDELYSNIEDFILNNLNGRLCNKFRNQTGFSYTPYFNTYNYPQQPIKNFAVTTTPQNLKVCTNMLATILDDLLTNGITDEEFEGFKEMWENRRERKTSIKYNTASSLFNKQLYNEPVFVKNFYEKTKNITKQDINNYLWEIYGQSKLAVVITGNYNSKDVVPIQTILSKYRPYDKYLNKHYIDHKAEEEFYRHVDLIEKDKNAKVEIEFLPYNLPEVEQPKKTKGQEKTKQKNNEETEKTM